VSGKIKGMVATAPDSLAGLRDRALLLLGFAGAFRRSELVALDVADLAQADAGLRVTIRKSRPIRKATAKPSHRARRRGLPRESFGGVAGGRRHLERPGIPPHQQGGHGGR
jgi:integrase